MDADEVKKLKVLDLFSGIGGFSLGLERAGMETVAFCEIDRGCQKVLGKHWPNVLVFNDVKKITKTELSRSVGHVDLICGGWPCQGNSVAGKLLGGKDERSGLWKEYSRIVKEIRPRWVVAENVSNVRNTQLAEVIKDLWKIGYDCEWYLIPASAVGAPHKRERLWLIAYPNSTELREEQVGIRGGKDPSLARKISEAPSDTFGCGLSEVSGAREQTTRVSRYSEEQDEVLTYAPSPRLQRYIQKEIRIRSEQSSSFTEFGDRVVYASGEFRDWFARALRVRDGVSRKLDRARLKQCGNAVVPQIPEIIGRAIIEWEQMK